VSFKNTIVIMTSNIGSEVLLTGIDAEGHISEAARSEVLDSLKDHFRPEFLNRLDDIVLFSPLGREQISRIVDLLMAEVKARLAEQGIVLALTDAARKLIADAGYDPVYGARPLKRFIQHQVETQIARAILGSSEHLPTLKVDAKDGQLSVRP
jgi:ATP-dependent Clp protease ATP-binding subunit ClpB